MNILHKLNISQTENQQLLFIIFVFLAIITLCIFYFSITSNDVVVGFLSDDAIFLLMAETYSPWEESISPVIDYLRFKFQFPPLYPVLLAVMGVDTGKPELASIITVSFLILAIILFGIWVWFETNNQVLTLLLPTIFALLPCTILFSQELWSEFLFMCFFYSAIVCLEKKKLSHRHWLGAALLIGLASLTRTIGITIIATFGIFLILKRPRKMLLLIVISILPLLLWTMFRHFIAFEQSYWEIITSQLHNNSVGNLFEFITAQFIIMGKSLYWLFSVTEKTGPGYLFGVLITTVVFFISLTGFITRIIQLKFDALCIPVYLGVILVWPHTGVHFVSRFLFPLLPIFIFYGWFGSKIIFNTISRACMAYGVCLLMIVAIACPAYWQFVGRSYMTVDEELLPYRRSRGWLLAESDEQALREAVYTRELFHVLAKVADHVPENECILSFQTSLVMLHTRRIAGVLPGPDESDEDFLREISVCRYILAMFLVDSMGKYTRYYPMDRMQSNEKYKVTPFKPDWPGYDEPVAFLIEQI